MARCRAKRAQRRREMAETWMAAFAAAVRERFPGCPPGEEVRVARYACKRGTSRVGSVASSSGYVDEAVDLAVVAHLRHRFSDYERLLGQGCSREQARERVEEQVSRQLRAWETPGDLEFQGV